MDTTNQNHKAGPHRLYFAFCLCAVAMLVMAGCASPNVNPSAAKARTGYVDFFCETYQPLSWDIAEVDSTGARPKELFSSFDPLEEQIVRLSFTPGRHRLRVTFMNRVILQKGNIEIDVKDGMITPVRIQFASAGTTLVERKEYSVGPTLHGSGGRTTKVGNYETEMWRVEMKADEPVPYRVKQEMTYAASSK